jgi:hypothetical protein
MNYAAALLLVVAATACDSRATASNGGDTVKADRLSRELESCGTTAHCAEGLRCWDRMCQREQRSALGDFLAARGMRLLASSDIDGAVAAYAEGLAAYEAAKLTVPPDLDCAYGLALARARGTKDKAELAARVLHRCILAIPVAVPLRAQALAGLAELDQVGLDPNQIARPQLADLYLTRPPAKPATDALRLSVIADPAPKGRTFALIPERLGQDDARTAIAACWEKNFAATQAKELAVKLPLEVKYKASEYDDEPGTYTMNWGPPGSGASDACVRAAVEPLVAALKVRDAFTTTLAITMK